MHNLMRNVEIAQRTSAVAVSDTSTDHTGSTLDMSGYEGIVFIALMNGTPTSTTCNLHVEVASSSSMGDAADSSGGAVYTSTTIGNGVLFVDVFRPLHRYVRYVMDRTTTDDAFDAVLALRYGAQHVAVTHSTALLYDSAYIVSPSS